MTFVCPEWEIEKIPRFARRAGYDGVEIRVNAGHKHGLSSRSSYAERERVRKLFQREGIEISSIATSVKFSFNDRNQRRENIEQAKEDIKLASHLGADVVRIFAGGSAGELNEALAEGIGDAFTEVGEFAKQDGVCPLL